MSFSYIHCANPSSLPSDYAAIHRHAVTRAGGRDASILEEDEDESGEANSEPVRPRWPTLAQSDTTWLTELASGPTERMPLLTSIPRIEEEVDGEDMDQFSIGRQYWEEARILVKYTLPVVTTHLLEYSLVIASVVSIGHISTTKLAAATLGSMTASVTGYSILIGFVSTLDTVLPSTWTSSEPQFVGLWCQRMAVVAAATLIPIGVIWLNAEPILLLVRQEAEIARLAGIYLRWALLGLPGYAFNQIARRYYQSQGLFVVPTRILIIVAPTNALLNYLLVWGPEFMRFGFIGAPIAAAISVNFGSLLYILYGIFRAPHTAWYPFSRRAFTSLGVLVQLGVAGVGMCASEWWSWELIGLAASLLGPVPLAAQSVLLVSASTAYNGPFALSTAAAVRIGNLLGEENARRAGIACKTSLLMALVIAGFNSTIFLVFRKSWGYLFNDDEDVVALVAKILPLVALFQVGDGLAGCAAGILRSRGKQGTGALLNLSAYYVFGIPLGLWLTFSRGWELFGLWVGLTVALAYTSSIGVCICLRTDWQRELLKVQARIEKERSKRGSSGSSTHV